MKQFQNIGMKKETEISFNSKIQIKNNEEELFTS